uniref:Putative lectin/glucanase superfamily protein n=1 Tax=viral metagenome TaxID=1070528 RepID=A0A6M3Y3G5_9ZZZZ
MSDTKYASNTGIPLNALSSGTPGELITWGADTKVAAVAVGTAGQVLTSAGAGAAPTFQAAAATSRFTFSHPLVNAADNVGSGKKFGAQLSGSGAISDSDGCLNCLTGATDGSKALIRGATTNNAGTTENLYDKDWEIIVLCILTVNTTGNYIASITTQANAYPGIDGSLTVKHMGFILDSTVLDASNADGTTQTTTDISAGLTLTNVLTYRVIMDSGTNVKFYVDGTLKATHTTNLPSGALATASTYYMIGVDNDTGDTGSHGTRLGDLMMAWNAE